MFRSRGPSCRRSRIVTVVLLLPRAVGKTLARPASPAPRKSVSTHLPAVEPPTANTRGPDHAPGALLPLFPVYVFPTATRRTRLTPSKPLALPRPARSRSKAAAGPLQRSRRPAALVRLPPRRFTPVTPETEVPTGSLVEITSAGSVRAFAPRSSPPTRCSPAPRDRSSISCAGRVVNSRSGLFALLPPRPPPPPPPPPPRRTPPPPPPRPHPTPPPPRPPRACHNHR